MPIPPSRRLHRLAAHVAAASGSGPAAAAALAGPVPALLSDAQMQRFVVDGFLVLPLPELAPDFHARLHAAAEQIKTEHGQLGNNIMPALPELGDVMGGPTVHGGAAAPSAKLPAHWHAKSGVHSAG